MKDDINVGSKVKVIDSGLVGVVIAVDRCLPGANGTVWVSHGEGVWPSVHPYYQSELSIIDEDNHTQPGLL